MLRTIVAALSVPLLLGHGASFAAGVSGSVGISATNTASAGGRATQTITITNSNITAGTGIRLTNTGGTQNVTIRDNRINAATGVLMNKTNGSQTVRANNNTYTRRKVVNIGWGDCFSTTDECEYAP
jgi:type 1 fimbria pilin